MNTGLMLVKWPETGPQMNANVATCLLDVTGTLAITTLKGLMLNLCVMFSSWSSALKRQKQKINM